MSVLLPVLSTNACRCDFQPSVSTDGSMDPVGTLRIVSTWLRDRIASQVGCFTSWRSIDVYRCDFDVAALSDASYVSVGTLCMLDGWLRYSRAP